MVSDQRSRIETLDGVLRSEDIDSVRDQEARHLVHHDLQDLGVDLLTLILIYRRRAFLHQPRIVRVLELVDVCIGIEVVTSEERGGVNVPVAVGVGGHDVVGRRRDAIDPGCDL